MKTIQELNERKILIIRINNTLKKYKMVLVFQKKVDKANEMLRTIGLPKSGEEIIQNSNKTNRARNVSYA